MAAYLAGGFFTAPPRGLRPEVLDGALDSAAALMQSQTPVVAVERLLLQVRTLVSLLSRPAAAGQRLQGGRLTAAERRVVAHHAQLASDGHIGLQAFAMDCLSFVRTRADLRGLYLHLLHVGRLLHLLQRARRLNRAQTAEVQRTTQRPVRATRPAACGPGR